MEINSRRIVLQGEYDLADKDALALLLGALPDDGPVAIDMSAVSYIDSTALHALAALRLRLEKYPVTLLGVNENLRRVFAVVNFDRLFTIVAAEGGGA